MYARNEKVSGKQTGRGEDKSFSGLGGRRSLISANGGSFVFCLLGFLVFFFFFFKF